ncbi:MAG: response regulator transcription factor [Candidatus Competibacterales bacterium]
MSHGHFAHIAVVDDDRPLGEALQLLLEAADYRVDVYETAHAFLEGLDGTRPSCVLLDLYLPDMNGLDVLGLLQQLPDGPPPPVIIITGQGDVPVAVQAMREGALDFVQKPIDAEPLLASVNAAVARDAEKLEVHDRRQESEQRLATLTPRENQVMEGLLLGKTNKIIARDLDISPRTVEIHRARLMEKLQVRSLAELVRVALEIRPAPHHTA